MTWELYLELDAQISKPTINFWHSLCVNGLVAVVLHDFVHLYMQSAAVECLDLSGETAKRLQKINLHLNQQVITMTFEPVVLKLLDNEYNVTGYDTNLFIAQLFELNLSATLPSLLHIDFDGFSLFIEGPILVEDLSLDQTPFLTSEV